MSMARALATPLPRRINPAAGPLFRSVWSWADAEQPSLHPHHHPNEEEVKKQQQQQQHEAHRLSSVIDAVNDRKLPPQLRGRPNSIRSEADIVNVVEQRIWRSMEEGHFENLPGKGKPLDLHINPHADPAEDTLYRILSKNGCAPEWVELNKEIRCSIENWRLALKKAWGSKRKHQGSTWLKDSESLKQQMCDINDKVLRYNLIVPFGRQMFGLKWEKEIDKLE